jgi:hypothetical protein
VAEETLERSQHVHPPNAQRKKQSPVPNLRRAYARAIIAETEEEYSMCEHQDYLDDAWSAVSQHRWFEQFGVIGPMPRDILEYIQKIAGRWRRVRETHARGTSRCARLLHIRHNQIPPRNSGVLNHKLSRST